MPVAPWRLLVLALLPLELLLLQLILAGADPGPAPLLELSLLWSLAVVAPLTVLLRKKGAGRLVLGIGVALLQAPLLIWLDGRAGQAALVTPWHHSSRLAVLLQAGVVLALLQLQLQRMLPSVPSVAVGGSVAIPPDQASTDEQGNNLNAEVLGGNNVTSAEPEEHGGQSDGGRSQEGEPEPPA
jgi:hypothetical protein